MNEGYPDNWINVVLMINKDTGEIHAIGGDRSEGDGDTRYIGLDLILKLIRGESINE